MPRVSGSAWPWLLADDSDAIVGIRSGNVDQLFVFSNDDALNIDMSNLAATWNASGTTFTAVKMNVTDTASAAASMLLDLQVGGTSHFHVTKGGAIHSKRSLYNIASANVPIVTVSNYSLTGSNADSLFDLAGTWNTSGTPTALKLNVTDTASAAASLLLDLQVAGTSQFSVSKGGRITAQTLTVGLGGQTAVATNMAVGFEALNSASLTGDNNVGVGYRAMLSNTTGIRNTAVGVHALRNYNASLNTAVGYEALLGNSTVANNTGAQLVAIGYQALFTNTSGSDNTAVGLQALGANTTGGRNSAVGTEALRSNTTGEHNSALGVNALQVTTTGGSNSAVGHQAIFSNTTGSNNSAVGRAALRENIVGSNCSAVGFEALRRFVSTGNQTAIGYRALYGGDATPANNTGANNIAIGYQAGDAITTGSANLAIGHDVDVDSATSSNQINIADRYFHDRIRLLERTSDPAKPAEGNMIVWMSDGTGLGDDGDVIISSTAGGVTNYAILFDHSGGTLWP